MTRCRWLIVALLGAGVGLGFDGPERASRRVFPVRPTKTDNITIRPTVKIRQGRSAGSGSLIASAPGTALILTAAHVVAGDGKVLVELHRYNLGVESRQSQAGWPKVLPGEVIAADVEADVALVRLSGLTTLPFVAPLGNLEQQPRPGEPVLSVGIDLGEQIKSWETRVRGVVKLNRGEDSQSRPFLVTERAPEHGRSGGGLFRADGRLIGVCVGRIEMADRRSIGLFASTASIRRLLTRPAVSEIVTQFPALTPNPSARTRSDESTLGQDPP
jgi:S1-C subfamily serine protease